MRKLLACLCFIGCAALPASAQDVPPPDQIVSENDKNSDGGIDRMEWAASPAPIPFPEEFDANKDNKIDVTELRTRFETIFGGGAPPPPAPAAAPQAPAPG